MYEPSHLDEGLNVPPCRSPVPWAMCQHPVIPAHAGAWARAITVINEKCGVRSGRNFYDSFHYCLFPQQHGPLISIDKPSTCYMRFPCMRHFVLWLLSYTLLSSNCMFKAWFDIQASLL